MVESLSVAVLLVLIAADVAAHLGRQRFRRAGDAFRCRVRTSGYTSAIWPRLRKRWSRRMWAMWVGDVLVVRRGPVLARTIPLRAQVSPTSVYAVSPREVRRLGSGPIAIDLRVWDGSRIEVAAQREARLSLVGPFLAAAVSALPQAPMPRSHS
jgi:hypothetical protein